MSVKKEWNMELIQSNLLIRVGKVSQFPVKKIDRSYMSNGTLCDILTNELNRTMTRSTRTFPTGLVRVFL